MFHPQGRGRRPRRAHLAAAHTGQELNPTGLASDIGITQQTAKRLVGGTERFAVKGVRILPWFLRRASLSVGTHTVGEESRLRWRPEGPCVN